jgi:hypothetical protein
MRDKSVEANDGPRQILFSMSRWAATRVAVAIILAVVIRRNVIAQTNLEASPTPQISNSPGLSARLTNATVRGDNIIELDFVLFNSSSTPIRLAERGNSWGASQWQFRIVDAKGTAYELKHPPIIWHANALTTFIIRPSEEQVTRCSLDTGTTSFSEGSTAFYTLPHEGYALPGELQSSRTNGWVFPVAVTGTFSASKNKVTGAKEETTWEGTITTKPLVIGKSSTNAVLPH